ncbi:MAG: hypothetical protein HYV76_00745 [Candidatus Vogelbacteria bacterium]|nr:hypothetical protein [Candidatus Vogelbacteria bacterium]
MEDNTRALWRNRAITILGVVVALVPFLGLPLTIDNFILLAAGLLIVLFGIVANRQLVHAIKYQEARKDWHDPESN